MEETKNTNESELPAELPAKLPAELPAELPAKLPAELPAELPLPLIESESIINANPSIEKMDSLVMKLQEYTKINISSIINNNSNTKNKNINNKIIKDESPEYYANEQLKFLNDACNEKDKRMNIVNNILNVSIIANVILISYILGTYFY
jgi:hypothetical protein